MACCLVRLLGLGALPPVALRCRRSTPWSKLHRCTTSHPTLSHAVACEYHRRFMRAQSCSVSFRRKMLRRWPSLSAYYQSSIQVLIICGACFGAHGAVPMSSVSFLLSILYRFYSTVILNSLIAQPMLVTERTSDDET